MVLLGETVAGGGKKEGCDHGQGLLSKKPPLLPWRIQLRERERERETERDRQKETDRERHRDRETETERGLKR